MSQPEQPRTQRPLLGGGERLRVESKRPPSGGPKTHPQTMEEAREHLQPQVELLSEAVAATPAGLRGARVIFEATVLPNYVANSYFPAELLRETDLVSVGTRSATGTLRTKKTIVEDSPTKTYLLAGDERSVAKLSAILSDEDARGGRETARERLRQFDLVRLPDAEELIRARPSDEELGARITWEAVLHPTVNAVGETTQEEHALMLAKWVAWVGSLGGEVAAEYERVVRGLTFVPVLLAPSAADELARFNPLRALRPMPKVRPTPMTPLRIAATSEPLPSPPPAKRPRSDLRVAVFDGGTDPHDRLLAPFVDAIDVTGEPEDPEAVAHGTMVSGAVLYGPLQAGAALRTPDVGVDSFRVLPAPSPDPWDVDLYWILDRIEEIVTTRNYSIVNLSLGPELSVDDQSEPHAWTARLDELAERRGVLFVTAAGNNGQSDGALGLNRVQIPADMVNGLAVGACDRRPPDDPWARAPYSAVGPGRAGGRIKPCGLAFGGVAQNPFRGIHAGGVVGHSAGTSFAAPTATHGIAGLAARLGRQTATPAVLRAFAMHFADASSIEHSPDEAGFGRLLERYDERWECLPNEVSVLYQDTIERSETIALPFPLPADAIAKGNISLRWTLVFTAGTDPSDAVDYTRAGLDVTFRPHANRFTFSNRSTGRSVEWDVQSQRDEAIAELASGGVPGQLPASKSGARVANEAVRRSDGKWETVLHFSKQMRAGSLLLPQLTVSYLAREDGQLAAADPLSFAMLVSLRGPKGSQLYDAVRASYPLLLPLSTEIPLQLGGQ